jgi:hypothetical protein
MRGGSASGRSVCGGSAGGRTMCGKARGRPMGCRPMGGWSVRGTSAGWSVRGTSAGRSMRCTAAGRRTDRPGSGRPVARRLMRSRGGRPISCGCFAYGAEHHKSCKNQNCRAVANNPVKKLYRHRILFSFPSFNPGATLEHVHLSPDADYPILAAIS